MMYVLQVTSGHELDVRDALRRAGYRGKVPEEIRRERRGGQWHDVRRILIPGYVFVILPGSMNAYEYITVRRSCMGYAIRILGTPDPLALTPTEERYIDWLINGSKPLEPSVLEAGEHVTVLAGPLKGREAQIIRVNRRQRRATIAIYFAGAEHRITLSADVLAASQTIS